MVSDVGAPLFIMIGDGRIAAAVEPIAAPIPPPPLAVPWSSLKSTMKLRDVSPGMTPGVLVQVIPDGSMPGGGGRSCGGPVCSNMITGTDVNVMPRVAVDIGIDTVRMPFSPDVTVRGTVSRPVGARIFRASASAVDIDINGLLLSAAGVPGV